MSKWFATQRPRSLPLVGAMSLKRYRAKGDRVWTLDEICEGVGFPPTSEGNSILLVLFLIIKSLILLLVHRK
jgi:hypothetical protein